MSEWLPGTWAPKGPPVVNAFTNPRFRDAGNIPAGAEQSAEWPVSGKSIYVPDQVGVSANAVLVGGVWYAEIGE